MFKCGGSQTKCVLTVNTLPWNLFDLCFEPNSCLPRHLSEVRKAPRRKIESERVSGDHPSDGLVSDKGEAALPVHLGGTARRGSVQGCPAGRGASDGGEQWRAVPGSGCAGRGCAPGGAGAALLTQQGALPWSPHPPPPGPETPQAGVSLEPKRAACVPACAESCHLTVGVDGASPPPVTPSPRAFFPKPGGRYQQLGCQPHLGTLGLGGDMARESRGA